jgi:hypothetical protein
MSKIWRFVSSWFEEKADHCTNSNPIELLYLIYFHFHIHIYVPTCIQKEESVRHALSFPQRSSLLLLLSLISGEKKKRREERGERRWREKE